jgi:hypothetical protein
MRVIHVLLLSLFLNACSPRLVSPPEPTQIPPTSNIQVTREATTAPQTEEIIFIAVADLTSRFSLDPQVVNVISIESHLWPDSALGCPQPGKIYAQQKVPGYRIRLEAMGGVFSYHTDAIDTVILCSEEELPSFPITPGEIDDGVPWMPVD